MDGTWRSTGALGWPRQRVLHELRNGREYRTFPPGISIDWRDPNVERTLDLTGSTVTIVRGPKVSALALGLDKETVAIEIRDGEAPSQREPATKAPAASPASRRPSVVDETRVFIEIRDEHPNDPLSEPDLLKEMKRRLDGASPVRERVRELKRTIGANWRRRRGAPGRGKSAV
jgi:hypothetical protein